MDKEQEKIIAELKEAVAKQCCDSKKCKSCGSKKCKSCGSKTPLEKRWNIEEKDKPSQA